jgi:hypothetical protein
MRQDNKKLVKRFHQVIKNLILKSAFYILSLFLFSFSQKKKVSGKQFVKNI